MKHGDNKRYSEPAIFVSSLLVFLIWVTLISISSPWHCLSPMNHWFKIVKSRNACQNKRRDKYKLITLFVIWHVWTSWGKIGFSGVVIKHLRFRGVDDSECCLLLVHCTLSLKKRVQNKVKIPPPPVQMFHSVLCIKIPWLYLKLNPRESYQETK